MERIKLAIENAKNPDSGGNGKLEEINQGSRQQRTPRSDNAHFDLKNTVKIILAAVLIFFAGWLWLRLDFMNQLELLASEYIHEGVKQAQAEAKKRVADEERFKQFILDNLTHCQAAAENNKESYIKLVKDAVRNKNLTAVQGKNDIFYIPKATKNKADMMLLDARAECQQIYDVQLRNGK